MGLSNTFATIPGLVVPSLVGSLIHRQVNIIIFNKNILLITILISIIFWKFYSIKNGLQPWHTVFYITAGLIMSSFFIFTIFGSTDEQPWNNPIKSNKIKSSGYHKLQEMEWVSLVFIPMTNNFFCTKNKILYLKSTGRTLEG